MLTDLGVLDLLVIFSFIIACLVIGFKTRGKVRNFDEYASGRKQHFGNGVIIATITASLCSASLFWNGVEQVYKQGLFHIIFLLVADIVGIGFMIYYFSPKMFKISTITLQEYFGKLYGEYLRAFMSFMEVVRYMFLFAMQLKLIGGCFKVCFNCSDQLQTTITIIAAVFLMVYSSYGGLKAVSVTDVCQFFFFIFLIPIIALYLWNKIGPEGHYSFYKLFDGSVKKMTFAGTFNSADACIAGVAVIIRAIVGIPVSTFYFQRVSMCKDVNTVKKNLAVSVTIRIIIDIIILFIGLQLLAVSHGVINGSSSKIPNGAVVIYMISFFDLPIIKTFFLISILSLAISTADTNFNCVSVLCGNDLLPLINIKKNKTAAILCGIVMCSIGLFFALYVESLYNLLLLGTNFFLPISAIPLILTIVRFKTHRHAIIAGIICGFIVMELYPYLLPAKSSYGRYAFGPGMLANLLGILIVHFYYKYKGWKWEGEDPDKFYSENERNEKIKTAHANLVAKMRKLTILNKKYNLDAMADKEIVLHFYMLDFVSDLPEYQNYKELLFKYRIKRPFKLHDRESDFDPEFQRQLCIDCLHKEDKIEYFKSQENSEKIDEIVKEMEKGM